MSSEKIDSAYPIKVSVCVVTYNQERYIDECLKGILNQNVNFEYEVIVSDDGSTDRTRAIINQYVEDYPGVVIPVFRKDNIGAFKNFIETHNLVRGEYVCHCDGDDRWLPNKLQVQVEFLDRNPDFTVVWGRMNIFDDSGNFYSGEKYDYSMFENGVVTFSQSLSLGSVASHSSVMYRSCMRETRSPTFDTLDLFYTWEFLSKGPGKILDQVLGEYRIGAMNAVTSNSKIRMRRLNALYASFYLERFPSQRKYIFMFALMNVLVDLKNRRSTILDFLTLALKSRCFIGPLEFYRHVKIAKKLNVPKFGED